MPRSAACFVNASLWLRSIIALRSEIPPCRAHVLKNRSPAPVYRSWRAAIDVDFRYRRFGVATAFKHVSSSFKKLLLPCGDLIWMHVELLSKLRNRPIVLQGGQSHLRLKAGVWFRRARLFIFAPNSQAKHACRQAEIPLNALFKIPGPPQY